MSNCLLLKLKNFKSTFAPGFNTGHEKGTCHTYEPSQTCSMSLFNTFRN